MYTWRDRCVYTVYGMCRKVKQINGEHIFHIVSSSMRRVIGAYIRLFYLVLYHNPDIASTLLPLADGNRTLAVCAFERECACGLFYNMEINIQPHEHECHSLNSWIFTRRERERVCESDPNGNSMPEPVHMHTLSISNYCIYSYQLSLPLALTFALLIDPKSIRISSWRFRLI